jgi:hypothetical protein
MNHFVIAVRVKGELVVCEETKAISIGWQARKGTPNIPRSSGVPSGGDRGSAGQPDATARVLEGAPRYFVPLFLGSRHGSGEKPSWRVSDLGCMVFPVLDDNSLPNNARR